MLLCLPEQSFPYFLSLSIGQSLPFSNFHITVHLPNSRPLECRPISHSLSSLVSCLLSHFPCPLPLVSHTHAHAHAHSPPAATCRACVSTPRCTAAATRASSRPLVSVIRSILICCSRLPSRVHNTTKHQNRLFTFTSRRIYRRVFNFWFCFDFRLPI